jgi:hypothetical protein
MDNRHEPWSDTTSKANTWCELTPNSVNHLERVSRVITSRRRDSSHCNKGFVGRREVDARGRFGGAPRFALGRVGFVAPRPNWASASAIELQARVLAVLDDRSTHSTRNQAKSLPTRRELHTGAGIRGER